MKYTFEYNTQEERQIIMDNNIDKWLTHEKNIREGNFLVFSDTKPIEVEVAEINKILNILIGEAENE